MLAKEIMPITIFEDRITNIDFDKLLDQMREEALDPGNVGNSKWEGGVIGSFSRKN
jgi:hypothetical protein